VVGHRKPGEVEREVRRLKDERLRLAPGAANTEEAWELLEAGWEQRGTGPKAIWRRPEGGRWYVCYQALIELRGEGPDAEEGTTTVGEDE
jgi:hypothetical protein